jgi:outer membrane lipoprotein SlyB
VALIVTCLTALGVMTGIVPSPLTRGKVDTQAQLSKAPEPSRLAAADLQSQQNRVTPRSEPRHREPERTASRAPAAPGATGATSSAGASNTVAAATPAPAHVCTSCGTVSSVRAVREQGEASMVGPAAGGLLGGVIGHQIGGGTGKTIATVVGAGVGAAAGTEAERRYKSTTHYVVGVRFNDGTTRSFTYANAPGVQPGDRVRLVDGQLVRD